MRKLLKVMFTAAVLFIAVLACLPVSADVGGFSVSPVFPENQNPQTRGFFDLRVTAGERQEIAVAVSNSGEENIAVSLSLITATTNRNGIVNYTGAGQEDETMLHPFAEVARIAPGFELVEIPPGGSVEVPIFIDIPQNGFDGIILGSIHALLEITDEQRAAAGMIVNRFAHVVAVRLQENDSEISTDFLLGEVRADLVNHRASIVAEVRNPQPRLSMGALAHAQIYPAGSETPIFARTNVNVDFAPNTVFMFSMIDEAGFGLQPGDYLARIQIDHGGIQWEFERDFEILPQQAEEINVAAVNIQHQAPPPGGGSAEAVGGMPGWVIPVIIGAAALIVVALAAFTAMSVVKKSKQQAKVQNEQFKRRMKMLEERFKEQLE